jgi:hypothetical protein
MSAFIPGQPGRTVRGRGRIQIAAKRAFMASDGAPVTTGDIRRYAYPRATYCEPSHCCAIRASMDRAGYRVVGERRPGVPIKWAQPAQHVGSTCVAWNSANPSLSAG